MNRIAKDNFTYNPLFQGKIREGNSSVLLSLCEKLKNLE